MAQGSASGGQMHAQAIGADGNVTINVMKHICSAEHVQDIDDFESVDLNGDGNNTFVDKVLACPTVVMPGDEYSTGSFHFDGKRVFDFEVHHGDGDLQTILDATFVKRQLCESEGASQDNSSSTGVAGADLTGDGDLDDCVDTSLYQYKNVTDGLVNVTETDTPGVTRPGALEFTPQALAANNDSKTLLEEENQVFSSDDFTIELDTSLDDEDNTVTLHVYNFPVCPTTSVTAEDGPQNNLDWTAVDGADAYQIYRGTQGSGFEELALQDASSTTYNDTDVEQGDTYRYQVTAIVDGEESQVCNTAVVTAVPVFSNAIVLGSAALLAVAGYAVVRRRS